MVIWRRRRAFARLGDIEGELAVPPRKKITKVLAEGGKGKLNDYIGQARDKYQRALLKIYTSLPVLATSSARSADKWNSSNDAYKMGPMAVFTDYRGCQSSSSVLRPHHTVTGSGLGTDAKPNVPQALADLQKDRFFKDTFVSGHVMNADFGGPGHDPKNQTILTSAANTAHKNGWETPVKKAQYYMTLVVRSLRCFQLPGAKKAIVDDIESSWRIELTGVVEATSWWDMLTPPERVSLSAARAEIAKSITTEVNFTAIAHDTPTMADLTGLKLDPDRDEFVAAVKYLKSFNQLMPQVANFKLEQTPNGFGKASVTSS
jgi:hypothetical protein